MQQSSNKFSAFCTLLL